MLKIWGHVRSSNVMKVLWLCEELGIAHERQDAGGAHGKTRDAFYLAMNPNARVPTIEDGEGFSLWESNTILRYLAATRATGQPIYPAAPRARAQVERWMDWQLAHLNGPMGVIFQQLARMPEAERNAAVVAKSAEEAQALWRMVEEALAGRDYLCGDALTLADVALGPYLHRWHALPVERGAPMPALAAWYARLRERHAGYATHIAIPVA